MTPNADNSERIRVVVADDHAVVRAGLRSLFQRQRDMVVVGEAANADELLTRIRELRPDVIVTDLRMPGGGVLDVIVTARREASRVGIVVFSAFDDSIDAARALRAGAHGYVLKQAPDGHLLEAIRRAHVGQPFVDEPIAARVAENLLREDEGPKPPALSERETAVLDLVAGGYTGPQIAAALGVRVGTVETYRHRIRKKLGLRSRAEVIAFARSLRFRVRERP